MYKSLLESWFPSVVAAFATFAIVALADRGVRAPVRWTPTEISSPAYESSPAFVVATNEMFFMRADAGFDNYRILSSSCSDGKWSAPNEASFSAPEGMHDADPFVSRDGLKLYFVSTRHRYHEVGNADFDIYVVERGADGVWRDPTRLPEPVNSHGSELFPRIAADGWLYFGSDRDGGAGGSDIYAARIGQGGAWEVRNIAGFNTASNEYEVALTEDGREAAVISDRGGMSRVLLFGNTPHGWTLTGEVRANDQVFQVGPSWSPDGSQLMFAQADGNDSGEIFYVRLKPGHNPAWPPRCDRSSSIPYGQPVATRGTSE